MTAQGLRERNKRAAMDQVRRNAFDLMDARGFDSVTVEEIAAASDVSPSTVYRYFGTKEALVLSGSRPAQLVERLADDDSKRDAVAAFERAANEVWGADPAAEVEIGLADANEALAQAFERQLLDQRSAVAERFAARRGKSSAKTKDEALAAATLGILAQVLIRWRREGGGAERLEKLLSKSLAVVSA